MYLWHIIKISIITYFLITVIIIFPENLYCEENLDVIETETGFYYTVKKGDTLWDLSRQFSNSPWRWPDLWHENKKIPNPHLIYPGQKIQLFKKTGMDNIKKISNKQKKEKEKEKILITKQKDTDQYYYYKSMEQVGFIRETPVSPSGKIFKILNDKWSGSERDIIYIKLMDKKPFEKGEKYTIYETIGPIKKKKELIGYQHYILGIVEITQVEPKFSIGKIIKSFRTIKVSNFIMPYEQRIEKIAIIKNEKNIEGNILLSEERKEIFGDHDIAFIDKGEKDQIKVGQFYSVYYQEKEPIDQKIKEETLLPPVEFGKFIVLHTEKTTSTVLITYSSKTIYPYAKFHTP